MSSQFPGGSMNVEASRKRKRPLQTWTKLKRARVAASIPRGITTKAIVGSGRKQFATLRYFDFVSINPASGAAGDYVFSANGVYDPDVTGTGHQPRGFDQLTALYDSFVVTKSTMKATIFPQGPSTLASSGYLIVSLQARSTLSTTVEAAMEYATKRVTTYGASEPASASPKTLAPPKSVTYTANPNGFLGRSNILDDDSLKSTASSNPDDQAYWHIQVVPSNTSADTDAVKIGVEIEYQGYFLEPSMPSAS